MVKAIVIVMVIVIVIVKVIVIVIVKVIVIVMVMVIVIIRLFRRGTNGVGTNGITAFLSVFSTEGLFVYSR